MFFGTGIPADVVVELRRIARQHEAVVVFSAAEATHIIDWDGEVDGVIPLELADEFILTLDVRPRPPQFAQRNGGVDVDAGTALVHWVYYPDRCRIEVYKTAYHTIIHSHLLYINNIVQHYCNWLIVLLMCLCALL